MIDFLMISTRSTKRGEIEIYPRFIIKKSTDLMIRGGDFYAVWIEDIGLWSTDEQDVLQLIDRELDKYAEDNKEKFGSNVKILHMWDAASGMIDNWHKYCQRQMRDSFHTLDDKLIFLDTVTTKEDYASKRLPYPLQGDDHSGWDSLVTVLYSPEERHKIEWSIGSIVTGASVDIQKFIVLYGSAGTGKSTVLNIIQKLFEGYYSVFDARALGSSSNSFALESFKSNPLVAIQHDGDLSKIEDNTRLNSLVSHELMTVNEKFKAAYSSRFKCFLYMGTNKPVKITDAKSGLIRRLIDVAPSGNKLEPKDYKKAISKVDFELGAIAKYCAEVFNADPGAYDDYIPVSMMGASNDFYNFVLDHYPIFKRDNGVTLKCAWEMYKTHCEEAKVPYPFSKRVFKEELRNYFKCYYDRWRMPDDSRVRSYYYIFKTDRFEGENDPDFEPFHEERDEPFEFTSTESIFDKDASEYKAQYATNSGVPVSKWDDCKTILSEIDTTKLHYVKVPMNHIVIDFDIPDENGEKDLKANMEAAAKWPETYGEYSKSGKGVHLHYIYEGDPSKLSAKYSDHIEVKVYSGNSSLRRMLTKCNGLPISTINSGLPLKGESKVVNFDAVKTEKMIRALIKKNLRKEVHPGTKPSIDFIHKILEDSYNEGVVYDVSDMKPSVLSFGASSSNQSAYCIKLVKSMKFKGQENEARTETNNEEIIFYDIEVFPNLLLVNWKFQGPDQKVVRLINPRPDQIEELMKFRLVGYNCRRYDNHIMYARMMGYDNAQIYKLSQSIITEGRGFFGEAYNLSYTDVYDFAAKKQSLKKWEIELGIHHQELGLPWDEPVPEDKWVQVAEYCDNDVIATEAVFDALKGDFIARKILAELAGMTVNDTTNSLTTRIIFGKEKNPKLVYTDLATGEQFD